MNMMLCKSLMNQLPVRKGMKIAYEKWKDEKKAVREKQLIVWTTTLFMEYEHAAGIFQPHVRVCAWRQFCILI